MQSLVVVSVGPILQAGGFVSGARTTQNEGAVTTIVTILIGGTLAVLVFGFIMSLRFRLNRDTHAVLMAEIERFKTGNLTPSSEENRAIVEDLSGWKYEDLWGRGRRTA